MSRLLSLPDPQALSIRAKALVFEDPASQALLAKVERVAASDATVLITGETGTGKELIARHVHTSSGRQGPFLAVNCGAFSDTMIEAELFGHEAGAYTGATQARAGWFEAANQGTLFLDEVGDLPMSMQVKLLRVLQERQVVRLGSRKSTAIDVRLVAATNVDLARAVEAGHFRRDLFYRLNIASLHLPPLAQRPLDILALAHHFIAIYAQRLGLSNVRLSQAAQAQLLAHHWPGNIRELENVIHCALIVGKGAEIQADALSLRGAIAPAPALPEGPVAVAASAPASSSQDGADGTALLRQSLRLLFEQGPAELFTHVERELVTAAYEACHFNQVHTSELLGISRNVLRTHLKRFGLLSERGVRRLHIDANGHAAPAKAWPI
ncbi:MAG: sigma-54-dependent Fis family transcriptional regulator [Burkholderiaceae bacterium]|nr:sigma-54-dependent Fis family transcriptional regulator [Roseateles sp.]MBV8470748.1 sigma-54-dependent Fis family transcriptional regulator [Burkholderiaceae bacterium]